MQVPAWAGLLVDWTTSACRCFSCSRRDLTRNTSGLSPGLSMFLPGPSWNPQSPWCTHSTFPRTHSLPLNPSDPASGPLHRLCPLYQGHYFHCYVSSWPSLSPQTSYMWFLSSQPSHTCQSPPVQMPSGGPRSNRLLSYRHRSSLEKPIPQALSTHTHKFCFSKCKTFLCSSWFWAVHADILGEQGQVTLRTCLSPTSPMDRSLFIHRESKSRKDK